MTQAVAWIALILSLFSSAVAAYQLQRIVRFRKPVFHVERAKFAVKAPTPGWIFVGPGEVDLLIRGASHPVTFTHYQIQSDPQKGASAGFGANAILPIPPEVWTPLTLPSSIGAGIDRDSAPERFKFEIYFSNPRDIAIVTVPLELDTNGSCYHLDEGLRGWKFNKKTVWRRAMPGRTSRIVSSLTRLIKRN